MMRTRTTFAILLASAAVIGTPAMAQTAPAPAASSTDLVPEILVTAQKRSQSIQKVSESLTVVSAQNLADRHLNDLDQLSLATPSLQLGTNNDFSIRGIGTLANSVNVDSSVAISYDEVNLGSSGLANNLFSDLARVEVLNGPQGLLFGKNATAGLLNIVTNKPLLGKTSVSVDSELDVRDALPTSSIGVLSHATVNLPVGENAALRVNLLYNYQQPITHYLGGGGTSEQNSNDYGIRAKFLYEPNNALSIYIIGEYGQNRGIAGNTEQTYRKLGAGSLNAGPNAADGIVPSPTNLNYAADGDFLKNTYNGGLQADISYKFSNGLELKNVAAWKHFNTDFQVDSDLTSFNNISLNSQVSKYDQYTDELRLSTPAGRALFAQVGAYFEHYNVSYNNLFQGNLYLPGFLLPQFPFCVGATTLGAPPFACPVDNIAGIGSQNFESEASNSFAAFGQVNYSITTAFRLLAGARVTHDQKSYLDNQGAGNYFQAIAYTPTPGTAFTTTDRYSDTNFSFKVGAEYDIVRDVMAYGTYSTGYKGPGFTTSVAPNSNETVYPETVRSGEIGIRAQTADHTLTLNVSGFISKFNNYQNQSFNTQYQNFVIQNAASATTKGAEATIIARPTRRLTLSGNVSIIDAKFGDFPGVQCYPGQATASCAVNGTFNANGLTTPTTPKFTSTIEAVYEYPLTPTQSLFVEANEYHRSSVNFLTNQAPGAELSAINVLSGSFGVKAADGKYSLSLFCKNCTNQLIPTSISLEPSDAVASPGHNPTASYLQNWGFNSTRTIGLRGSVNF